MLFIQWDILPVKLLIKPKPSLRSGEGVLCTDCLFTDAFWRKRWEEERREGKGKCRAINTFGSKPELVQPKPSAFPSYTLLLSCSNKPCLLKATSLLELSNHCFALICRVQTGAWSLYSWWELQMLAILPSQGLPPLRVWCQRSHWDLWQLLPVQSFRPD